jgi:hypothetical protein
MKTPMNSIRSLVLAFCALMAGLAPATVSLAQEQARPGDKLATLLNERLAVARQIAKAVNESFKNRSATVDELLEASRLVLGAELALCDSNKARIAVLEKYATEAKKREAIAMQIFKTGQGTERLALKARADRLQAEIAIEKARAAVVGQAPQPAGAAVALAQSQVAIQQAAVKVADAQRKTAVARRAVVKGELAEALALEKFAEKQARRMQTLLEAKSIEVQLADEQLAKWEAAKARRASVEGKVLACEAQEALEQARVERAQAEADHARLRLKQLQAPLRESSRLDFWIDPGTGDQYFVGIAR